MYHSIAILMIIYHALSLPALWSPVGQKHSLFIIGTQDMDKVEKDCAGMLTLLGKTSLGFVYQVFRRGRN